MGFVDICFGGFAITIARQQRANFIVHSEPVYLVSMREEDTDESAWVLIAKTGEPFTLGAWVSTLVFLLLIALHLTYEEWRAGGNLEDHMSFLTAYWTACFNAVTAFLFNRAPFETVHYHLGS